MHDIQCRLLLSDHATRLPSRACVRRWTGGVLVCISTRVNMGDTGRGRRHVVFYWDNNDGRTTGAPIASRPTVPIQFVYDAWIWFCWVLVAWLKTRPEPDRADHASHRQRDGAGAVARVDEEVDGRRRAAERDELGAALLPGLSLGLGAHARLTSHAGGHRRSSRSSPGAARGDRGGSAAGRGVLRQEQPRSGGDRP